MNPDTWKLVLAFGGLFLTTVTGPIMWALVAESRRIRAEMAASESRLKSEITGVETRLDKQITHLEKQMTEMERRLNQRIDTRLVHK